LTNEAPGWLGLLAPLPAEAQSVRQPVLSEQVKAANSQSEVAGWTSLSLHLSAPEVGLRVVLATFDARGQLLSASDLVHRRRLGRLQQQSLGGRFEIDGSFRGARWDGTATDPEDRETADWDLKPSEPGPGDGERLRALVEELKQRERQ
jgi:hypothetical protein